MGGADQWGNITAGLELIRRRAGLAEDAADRGADEPAHAIAYNLLLSPSGAKFGKTEGGTSVWLDAERTSPYAFYQYWLNTDDRDAGTYLRWFTLLGREEIEALEASLRDRPEARDAQRALARDVTGRTHGPDAARQAEADAAAMFGEGDPTDPAQLARLFGSVDSFEFAAEGLAAGAGALAVASGSYSSNSEARRGIQQGSLWINGRRIAAFDEAVEAIAGRFLVIRTGKRRKRIGRLTA
jgi:tyrosyl-tRNA synthetase